MEYLLCVSARSRPSAVAGAIAGITRDGGRAHLQTIGAAAVNQAVKGIVVAHGYLAADGIEIACVPEFGAVVIDGQERPTVRLLIGRSGDPIAPLQAVARAKLPDDDAHLHP